MNKQQKWFLSGLLAGLAGLAMYKWYQQQSQSKTAPRWTADDIPDLSGQVIIVTGANSGIGFEATKELVRHGAQVIMACRSVEKATAALSKLQADIPSANAEVMALDLGDLDSVRAFATAFQAKYNRLDVLINNAGVMIPPYGKTAQGFELQIGVNHLGHFALTGLLLNSLLTTPASRVVTVSSGAHQFGKMDFDDLHWEQKEYNANAAYGQSKLANLLFTYELQRKLNQAETRTLALAAHPGWSATNLQQHSTLATTLNPYFAQSQAMGALPTLRAAVDPHASGGQYYGPGGLMEMRGYPVVVSSNEASHNLSDAQKLWQVSEELTGVQFSF
jgi:NAD(P)-dependent dehydrogenase (short-subunit alcohol dehydrogenase family)